MSVISDEEFFDVVKTVREIDVESVMDIRIEDTALDSLDIMELRATLELATGKKLTDREFFSTSTLSELLKVVRK